MTLGGRARPSLAPSCSSRTVEVARPRPASFALESQGARFANPQAICHVGDHQTALGDSSLKGEAFLEAMVVSAPAVLFRRRGEVREERQHGALDHGRSSGMSGTSAMYRSRSVRAPSYPSTAIDVTSAATCWSPWTRVVQLPSRRSNSSSRSQ